MTEIFTTFTRFADMGFSVIIEENAVHCHSIWGTGLTRESLLEEVLPAGFICDGFYGDAAGKRYDDGSEILCAVFGK